MKSMDQIPYILESLRRIETKLAAMERDVKAIKKDQTDTVEKSLEGLHARVALLTRQMDPDEMK